MSLKNLKEKLKSFLPRKVIELLKWLLSSRVIFKPLNLAGSVVQIYVNDEQTESYVGVNNFYSFLLADQQITARVELEFFDSNGHCLCKHKADIENLSSHQYSVKEIFNKYNVHSEFGIVSLKMLPKNRFKQAFRRLGLTAPHFFMFYKSSTGSLGHVHPSSVLDSRSTIGREFVSNQTIRTTGIEKVVLYQVNPSRHSVKIVHQLFDDGSMNRVVMGTSHEIGPMAAIKISFDLKNTLVPDCLGLRVSPLPTPNSKPMLMRVYGDGQFSLSHS